MHPYIGIVRTYRRSEDLSTRPDDQNTLTRQSSDTNDAPRDPLHDPIKSFHFCVFVLFTVFPGSLRYHHHCDFGSHHNDDDVEGMCFQEYWKYVQTKNDEVKYENAPPDQVYTSAYIPSLVFFIFDI